MVDKLITPEFRGAYVGLTKATAPKDNPNGAKKYSIRAVFPATTDISALKTAAHQAAVEKWGNAIPKTIRSPFRLNKELDNPIADVGDDAVVMTFSANEDRRPGVVDRNREDIIDDSELYSGAWFVAQVRPYAYDQAGNRGIAFGLENVMKLKDDKPLGSGRIPAKQAFADFTPPAGSEGSGAKSGADIFA